MKVTRLWMASLLASVLFGCSHQPLAPESSSALSGTAAGRGAQGMSADLGFDEPGGATTLSDVGNDGHTLIAVGAIQFDIPASVFGTLTDIDNKLQYSARRIAGKGPEGHFSYTQSYEGNSFVFSGVVTCLHIYDFDGGTNNRAKIGGRIDQSNDPTIPVGTYIWWQQIDNTQSPGNLPDKSTISGFGDEAANEAFCISSANPRRIFDVDTGNILVRVLPPHGGVGSEDP